ncbi:MAG: dTDP-4-dehydrorhamnose 3,5-epimerase [candidate division Zixibacteria bacterium]|nr:dTDP-4-dehydrorhamnose 3,5-epimerase [candidate division Zixibacteria bacterium]
MIIKKTKLEGLVIIEPEVFRDNRGFFTESYSKRTLKNYGFIFDMVQDNHSLSFEEGTIRGLHYQLNPKAQTKIVRALRGSFMDVAVDIRKGSPTFGKWESIILTAENMKQVIIPKGFAHGICTTAPNTEVFYKVDQFYNSEYERAIRWDDPELAIDWPYVKCILSDKDRKAPFFPEAEINFIYKDTR